MAETKLILPYDTDSEAGVVCSLMRKPELFNMSEFLKPNHFYNEELGATYWAIGNLLESGIYEIDSFNLIVKCNENKGIRKLIDKYGGDNFIKELVDNSENVARDSVDEYLMVAKRVSELGFRRELYRKLRTYESESIDETKNLGELHGKIINGLDGLANEYMSNQKQVLFRDKVDIILNDIEEKRKRGVDGLYGLPWFTDNLTKTLGGLTSGELYLIAGRRKSGKSVFMLNEAIHKANMGLKVLMTSSELTDEKDTLRMLSIISGIPIEDIKLGKIADYSYQKYKDAIHFIKHADFHREYDSAWSPEKVIMKAKTIKHKLCGLDYVVHDYIKDVKSMGSAEKSNALGAYCDALKNGLAGEMDIPCLSGVQLNRNNEIGDSDGLERYSTAAIKWERKTKEQVLEDGIECGNFKMGVLFARDGHTLNDEEDYLDYYMDLSATSNLRIYDAKEQHSEDIPQFMG